MARKRGEGTRGVFWDNQKGGYVVQYNDVEGRKRREFVGASLSTAERLAKKRRQAVREARMTGPTVTASASDAPPLVEFMAGVLRESKATKRTWRDDARYAIYWGEAFPDARLDQVTPADIQQWRQRRLAGEQVAADAKARPVKPATVNRAMTFLKRVFNEAIDQGLCSKNPVAALKMLRENNLRTVFLSVEQEAALKAQMVPEKWHFVEVALETGMRKEEQMTMRWENVDFSAAVITVPRSKHGEVRYVAMTRRVREILEQLRRDCPPGCPWVYPDESGTSHVAVHSHARKAFEGAVERAKIGSFRWHDLRHTYASRLVMAGVDLRTVADLLGHKTLAMVMRYAHLAPEHRQAAAQKAADLFRPATPPSNKKRRPRKTKAARSEPAEPQPNPGPGEPEPPNHPS